MPGALFRMHSSSFTLICHHSAVLNMNASHIFGEGYVFHTLHQILSSKYISCPPPPLFHFCSSVSAINPCSLAEREGIWWLRKYPSFSETLCYSLACLALNFPPVYVCVCVCFLAVLGPLQSLVLSELALYSL